MSSLPTPAPDDTAARQRDFYDGYLVDPAAAPASTPGSSESSAGAEDSKDALMDYIWRSVVGSNDTITTPYGQRKITYADYTASGRALSFIEEYIQHEVLPLYANTHTLSDTTGLQSTLFRQEAREIIKRNCRCSVDDTVIFAGSGATSGMTLAAQLLGVARVAADAKAKGSAAPVVLVGPFEHHSNLLPWREAGATVVTIPEEIVDDEEATETSATAVAAAAAGDAAASATDAPVALCGASATAFPGLLTYSPSSAAPGAAPSCSSSPNAAPAHNARARGSGRMCRRALLSALTRASSSAAPLLVCTFSAASNVTGALEDTEEVTAIAKRFGAIVAWDYAAAGPYVPIDMNPGNSPASRKDMVFISPHKMVGGVATPGVLVVKKALLSAPPVPARPGGGTVLFVSPTAHTFLANLEEKEEGGTPDVVGSIRAGLAFQLKESLGAAMVTDREHKLARMARIALGTHAHVALLGCTDGASSAAAAVSGVSNEHSLPILSFVIRYAPDPALLLHHNFVAALLNDLFGIQARAGCACAGPYVQSLMGITSSAATAFLGAILDKQELVRPGMVRVALSYFAPEAEAAYILRAIRWVATHGWKLLPSYAFVVASGEFKHRSRLTKMPDRRWLSRISYASGAMQYTSQRSVVASDSSTDSATTPAPVAVPAHSPAPAPLTAAAAGALLASYEDLASVAVAKAERLDGVPPLGPTLEGVLSDRARALRWFPLPDEANADLRALAAAPASADDGLSGRSWPWATSVPAPAPATYSLAPTGAELAAAARDAAALARAAEEGSRWLGRVQWAVRPQRAFRAGTACDGEDQLPPVSEYPLAAASATAETTTEAEPVPEESVEKKTAEETSTLSTKTETEAETTKPAPKVAKKPYNKPVDAAVESLRLPLQRVAELSDAVCQTCFHEHKTAADAAGSTAGSPQQQHSRECSTCECVNFVPRLSAPASKKAVITTTRKLASLVGHALGLFQMVREGDRILVGVSGGKDSLTLIHMLLYLQRKSPVRFHIGAATVDPQTPEYDPSLLKRYFAALGVPYHYEAQPIMQLAMKHAEGNPRFSICSFCSRMRRGVLYTTCRRYGYNVLALGQHLDDLAESFVMSSFHNGLLRTMKVHYTIGRGDVRVIRPLCFVRESKAREFAKLMGLPVINENCPACFEAPKERQRVKLMLAAQEAVHPNLYNSLQRAMMPLLRLTATGAVDNTADDLINQLKEAVGVGIKDEDDEGADGEVRGKQKQAVSEAGTAAGSADAAKDANIPSKGAEKEASEAAETSAENDQEEETQILIV